MDGRILGLIILQLIVFLDWIGDFIVFFFLIDTATTGIYTLSLHDALPISAVRCTGWRRFLAAAGWRRARPRSEEHTSELQSRFDLVCRLLLEKKNVKEFLRDACVGVGALSQQRRTLFEVRCVPLFRRGVR